MTKVGYYSLFLRIKSYPQLLRKQKFHLSQDKFHFAVAKFHSPKGGFHCAINSALPSLDISLGRNGDFGRVVGGNDFVGGKVFDSVYDYLLNGFVLVGG